MSRALSCDYGVWGGPSSPSHVRLSFVPPQHVAFERRRAQLRAYVSETKYARQKDRLRADFEAFLLSRAVPGSTLATAPSLLLASPRDVVRFLCLRDGAGRT